MKTKKKSTGLYPVKKKGRSTPSNIQGTNDEIDFQPAYGINAFRKGSGYNKALSTQGAATFNEARKGRVAGNIRTYGKPNSTGINSKSETNLPFIKNARKYIPNTSKPKKKKNTRIIYSI